MATFFKKNSLIKTICFLALMSAINVIFSLLTTFVPFLGIVLVIFLPLTSAVVEVVCKDRYFPIYAAATLGLSIVVSLSSIDFTIFYVLPSIVSGYIFGLMAKKNMPDFAAIFISSCTQTIISFAFIPLIELITERNLIDDIVSLLKIEDKTYFNYFLILIFFVISLIQTILSFIVVNSELKRIGIKHDSKKSYLFISSVCVLGSILLLSILKFFSISFAYIFLGFAWYFAVFVVYYEIKEKRKLALIFDGIFLLINVFVFAALNQKLSSGTEFLLFGITPLLISILSLVFFFLKKQK